MTTPASPDPRRWRALAVCLVAGFMTLLDVSIVNVALPPIQRGLGASASELSWVVSGYALTFGLVLVSAGRLGDDRGRKKLFLIALALFTLTSALAGVATDPTWLVVARLVQGAAGGMLNPQIIGVIQQLFSGPERGRAFGLFGAAIGISTAVGPVLGGLLLQWGGDAEGWRWVFYVNVPIGVAALALGAWWLPRDRPSGERRPLDLVGALLLGAAVVALMFPLVLAEQDAASAPWWLVAVAVALFVVFGAWERRARRTHGHPLVNFGLLRTRSYALGTTLGLVYFAGFTSIFFVLTLYYQQGRAYSPLAAGLALTPFALGSAVTSALGGRLVSRVGRPLVVTGLVLVAAGLVATDLVLRTDPSHVGWATAGPLLVAGLGSGLVIAPNQTLALEGVPPREGGTAAGVLQTGQRVGSAVGIAAVGAVFFASLAPSGGAPDWGGSISAGLLVTTGLVVIALLVGVADLLVDVHRRHSSAATGPPEVPEVPEVPDVPDVPGPRSALPGAGAGVTPHEDGRAAVLVGRVTDGRHGPVTSDGGSVPTAGVGDAVLTLVDVGGRQAASARSDPDGAFRLEAPLPGTYQLVVTAGEHRPDAGWVTVPAGGSAREVPLRAAPRHERPDDAATD